MNDLISIIVPVYKVEAYLKKCLDSLVAQTYENIEIILIDDGSPDASGLICDAYAERDGRIRVFHTENRGVSAARNLGIGASKGRYLMFADSDDWVEPDFCRMPYEAALKTGADIVMFRMNGFRDGKTIEYRPKKLPEGIVDKKTALDMMLFNGIFNYVWNKLFKRELFDGIEFPVGRTFEDVAVTHKLLIAAEVICVINDRLYNYNEKREGSITTSSTRKDIADFIDMMAVQKADILACGYPEARINAVRVSDAVSYIVRRETSGKKFNRRAQYYDYCSRVIREYRIPARGADCILSRKKLMQIRLYKFSPALFRLACRIKKKL